MIELDKIYNEDCLEGMKRIADGAVDCIITDLPYGTTACAWDSVIPFEPLWEQFKRVTKPNAAIVLFAQQPFASVLAVSNLPMFKYEWIWEKDNSTGFLHANQMPLKIHENILVFYRELPTYNPQGVRHNPRKVRRGHLGDNYLHSTSNEYQSQYENYPIDMFHFDRDEDKSHPTQKPVDLLRYLILTYSNEGDTILDATIGSGTTAVAALMEKRHFIGFETNKEYFDIAQGRIDQVLRNPTLF